MTRIGDMGGLAEQVGRRAARTRLLDSLAALDSVYIAGPHQLCRRWQEQQDGLMY